MCGISAIINVHFHPVGADHIKRMNNKIKHRGPDGEGFFIEENLALGHRMLKIIDLTDLNVQPMRFKDYIITYNGEIYNYRILRQELKESGYKFYTDTDTEVILAAYDKWKEQCVQHFNGMWAFLIYDKVKNTLFCSRDRFGIKPLYYLRLNDKFIIGSEIKQFTVFNDFYPKLNLKVAHEFLFSGKLNTSDETFFERVKALPAGHNLNYHLPSNTFTIDKWYDLNHVSPNKAISFQEAVASFREMFFESMLQQLFTRVPAGSTLSGGMDTSSMVAVANKMGSYLTTYSSCFYQTAFNEIDYIDSVVAYYNLPNKKVFPDIHELLLNQRLAKIVYHQDQPISGGSFFSEYKVFEMAAAQKTRVILSGQGADEYLGGYGEFYRVFLKTLLQKGKLLELIDEISYSGNKTGILKDLCGYKWLRTLARSFASAKQTNPIAHLCFNKHWLDSNQTNEIEFSRFKNFRQLSIAALVDYSLPHQLHSEDRNSMLHSIESRLPFLDHRLVEFSLSLPDNFKIQKAKTKFILRESMRSILPPEIYNRRTKLGFPGPEEPLFIYNVNMIRNKFEDLVYDFPEIFNDNLLKIYAAYCDKKIGYDGFLFRALAFGAWAREFNISLSSAHLKKAFTPPAQPEVSRQAL